jgi:hypothetical protein
MRAPVPTYAITEGGLMRRIERTLRITRGGPRDWLRRAVAFVLIAYIPMMSLAVGARLVTGQWPHGPLLILTHVRALVAIPLLLAAEPLVDARATAATWYLGASRLLSQDSTAEAYRAALARTARLRDSNAGELIVFACALASLVADERFLASSSVFAWVNVPAIVMFRFLLLRWLWRWLLWGLFVWRVSRLPLALRATHPDRLGGVGPLLAPAYPFSAVVAAGSSAIAGGLADRFVHGHLELAAYSQLLTVYAAIAVILAFAPTLSLMPLLYQARKDGIGRYGAFAHRFSHAYEARWYDADGKEALGTPDISSMADLGTSYDVVTQMRVLPWHHRLVLAIVAGSVLPVVPLAIVQTGVAALAARLGKMLL